MCAVWDVAVIGGNVTGNRRKMCAQIQWPRLCCGLSSEEMDEPSVLPPAASQQWYGGRGRHTQLIWLHLSRVPQLQLDVDTSFEATRHCV